MVNVHTLHNKLSGSQSAELKKLQSNLVNSKSYGLEILFRSMESYLSIHPAIRPRGHSRPKSKAKSKKYHLR